MLKRMGGALLWLGALSLALFILGYMTGIIGTGAPDAVSAVSKDRLAPDRGENPSSMAVPTAVPVRVPARIQGRDAGTTVREHAGVTAQIPKPLPSPILKPAAKSGVIRLAPPPVREPSENFAEAALASSGWPGIVVVIDDLGLDPGAVARLSALEGPLTLAFLPYAKGLPGMTAKAKSRGHELIVHLPMEPKGAESDPGPMALRTGLSEKEFARRLAFNLDRFHGYVGVNNHMGSALTEDSAAMGRVMAELSRRGLLYLDSRTTPLTVAERTAAEHGVAHASRDIFLDNEQSAEAVAANLRDAERVATKTGLAIVIGHPHPETISALEQWLPAMRRKGFQLVPLSAAVIRTPSAMLAESTVPGAPDSTK